MPEKKEKRKEKLEEGLEKKEKPKRVQTAEGWKRSVMKELSSRKKNKK